LEQQVLVDLAHQAGPLVEIQYLAQSQQLVADVVVCKPTTLVVLVVLAVAVAVATVEAFKLTLVAHELHLQFKVLLVVVVVTQVALHLVVAAVVELAQQELTGAMKSAVMVEMD
jgi:hypothetical protein